MQKPFQQSNSPLATILRASIQSNIAKRSKPQNLPLSCLVSNPHARAKNLLHLAPYTASMGAFSHSARAAPIITLFILGTPLKTTPLQKRA